ncbi:MAG TPA: mechanosensitive ion channel domain-containing protein, partial [Candidatus Bathyarchaeia archaeon]|nr:mechanosensitive ion channel domain-containing protein [Candidatus Bathyarchaeia archaeon]
MAAISLIELAVRILVAITGFWLVGQLLIRSITASARRAGIPQAQLHIFKEGLMYIFIVLATVTVVHLSGLTSEFTALTISGIAAVVLSLALQTTLSNVIAGILILLDNTLRLNDVIQYSGIKGQVVKIGLRNSWIKTG